MDMTDVQIVIYLFFS